MFIKQILKNVYQTKTNSILHLENENHHQKLRQYSISTLIVFKRFEREHIILLISEVIS
jgi:hypothetical protein